MDIASLFRWIGGYRSIGMQLFTRMRGELVGKDEFGNCYYRDRRGANMPFLGPRERRWVTYAGDPEGSAVPPAWHAWLHHTVKEVPDDSPVPARDWQRDYVPNLSGSAAAYRPPGHTLEGNKRDKATGDYEPWVPN